MKSVFLFFLFGFLINLLNTTTKLIIQLKYLFLFYLEKQQKLLAIAKIKHSFQIVLASGQHNAQYFNKTYVQLNRIEMQKKHKR